MMKAPRWKAVNPSPGCANDSIERVAGLVRFMPMPSGFVMTNAPPHRPTTARLAKPSARSDPSVTDETAGTASLLQSPARVVLSMPSPGPIVVDSVIFFM